MLLLKLPLPLLLALLLLIIVVDDDDDDDDDDDIITLLIGGADVLVAETIGMADLGSERGEYAGDTVSGDTVLGEVTLDDAPLYTDSVLPPVEYE